MTSSRVHASEDKDAIVWPLVRQPQLSGVTVWYDEDRIILGDNWLKEMDKGFKAWRIVPGAHPRHIEQVTKSKATHDSPFLGPDGPSYVCGPLPPSAKFIRVTEAAPGAGERLSKISTIG